MQGIDAKARASSKMRCRLVSIRRVLASNLRKREQRRYELNEDEADSLRVVDTIARETRHNP